MFCNFKKEKGFTLIELLVVISIIGLLSSVVLASLNTARAKARDARRQSDMNQIWIALNLYYDRYGCLPRTSGSNCGVATAINNCGGWDYSSQTGACNGSLSPSFLGFLETSGFMPKVPVDPINNMTNDNSPPGTYAYKYYCYISSEGTPGPYLGYYKESGTWTSGGTAKVNQDSSYSCL